MQKILLAVLIGACALQAQTPKEFLKEARDFYNGNKDTITRAAAKMTEADYAFKPTPEVRTYGQIIGHIADTNVLICSMVSGSGKKNDASKLTSKAELSAALKASFDECDKAFDSVTEANAAEVIGQGFLKRTRLNLLQFNTMHNNEMYGYASVYLRLKNIVPPSSEPRKGPQAP
jgi:uncharacterized damage-inducible protein DinB